MWAVSELVQFSCSIPSIALDLLESEEFTKNKNTVESVAYGGAVAPSTIPRAVSKLPSAIAYVSLVPSMYSRHLPTDYFITDNAGAKVSDGAGAVCIIYLTRSVRFPWKGYGLTETSGGCVSVSGGDYLARPLSTYVFQFWG